MIVVSPIGEWLTETLPKLYAPGRRKNVEMKISGTDFWLWLDASRPTNRMTERSKRHLFRVETATRNRKPQDFDVALSRDINLTARTHWPVQRTMAGRFAKGHIQNVRIVKDPLQTGAIVQNYGTHLWTLELDTPDDSRWMLWDGKLVDLDTMLGLLNFERHPDNPSAAFESDMMHKPRLKEMTLFDEPEIHNLDQDGSIG